MNQNRGAILISACVVVVALTILSAGVVSHALLERKAFEITKKRTDAFYLAEAGMDEALAILRAAPSSLPSIGPVSVSRGSEVIGQYEAAVEIATSAGMPLRKITATGYVPQKTVVSGVVRQMGQVEGVVYVPLLPPSNFFDNAVYAVDDVEFQGGSYVVTGDIDAGSDVTNTGSATGVINGTVTPNDPTVTQTSFYSLDFQSLRERAISQNNVYVPDARGNYDRPFPTDFWKVAPTDPADPLTGVPNIVYVEGPLALKGGDTIGGFVLVVGNIMDSGTVSTDEETASKGNITVHGFIYTTGDYIYKGGGGMLIDGGILTGGDALLNGNNTITYNPEYGYVLKKYLEENTDPTLKLLSWRQLKLYE